MVGTEKAGFLQEASFTLVLQEQGLTRALATWEGLAGLQPAGQGLECQAKHFGCQQLKEVFVFKDFIYLFSERGREGEREGEKHQSVASCTPPTGDLVATQACALARNRTFWFAGWCPDH